MASVFVNRTIVSVPAVRDRPVDVLEQRHLNHPQLDLAGVHTAVVVRINPDEVCRYCRQLAEVVACEKSPHPLKSSALVDTNTGTLRRTTPSLGDTQADRPAVTLRYHQWTRRIHTVRLNLMGVVTARVQPTEAVRAVRRVAEGAVTHT